jgi:hypothetical protein
LTGKWRWKVRGAIPTASQIRSTVAEVDPSARKMSRAVSAIVIRSSSARRSVKVGLLGVLKVRLHS